MYIYSYICIYICGHGFEDVFGSLGTCKYTDLYVRMNVFMCRRVCTYECVCVHTSAYVGTQVSISICIHMYIYIYIYM